MIFTTKTATAIDTGRKVQHRVPIGRTWRIGQRIRIQHRPVKDALLVCHVQITNIEPAVTLTIDRQQARQEGFDGVRGLINFKRDWLERHDKAWVAKHTPTEIGLTDEFVAERFDSQTYIVDILTFELADDAPRFLAKPGPHQGDYTEQRHRAIDDLEVIDSFTQERYAKKARQEGEKQRASFKRDLAAARAAQRKRRLTMFRDAA